MAGLTQVIRESLEKLASKEGKSADELFQVYRQKFGAGAADAVIDDAKKMDVSLTEAVGRKEAPGGIPERDATLQESLGFNATPAPFGAEDAAAIERGKAIPPADASRVAPIEAVTKPGMSAGKKLATGAGLAATGAGVLSTMGETPSVEAKPTDVSEGSPTPTKPTSPASSFKDEKAKSLVSTVERAKSPADYQEVVKRFEASKEDLPEADRNAYESKLTELNDTISKAKAEYDAGKNRTAWAEVAETLGQALVQLGAGYQGMKTGVDLSGVKFNKTDWSKRYDTLLSELKQETGLVETEKKAVREEFGDKVKGLERRNENLFKGMLDDYLSEKKVQADIRSTAQKHKNDLEIEGLRVGSREAIAKARSNPQLTKARNEAQKRLNVLNSAFSQLAAAEEAGDSKKRNAAISKFKDELRSIGKDSLVDEIEKEADSSKWLGSDYGSDSVKKIIQAQRDEAQKTLDMFGAASPDSTSESAPGKVRMRAPNGEIAIVDESLVSKYEAKGATRID